MTKDAQDHRGRHVQLDRWSRGFGVPPASLGNGGGGCRFICLQRIWSS